MLAYPLDEAETLLRSKLDAALASLANCDEDLDFLREQITVSFSSLRPNFYPRKPAFSGFSLLEEEGFLFSRGAEERDVG
jgi:hypothetical protein